MIRCAIVGAGAVVEDLHLSAFRGLPQVEVAAICENDSRRAGEFLARTGVPRAYPTLDALLAEETHIDFVDIATPAHTHYELVRQALEAGLHVIVEKPLALNARQGAELGQLARKLGRKLCVFQTYRYRSPALAASEALQGGFLGRLTQVSVTCRWQYDPFEERRAWDWAEKGSRLLLYELGVHYVDLAIHFAGPVRSIVGSSAQTDPESGRVTGVAALLKHESEAQSIVDLSVLAPSQFIRLELYGTKGDGCIKLWPESFVGRAGTISSVKEVKTELKRTSRFAAETALDLVARGGVRRRARPHYRVLAGFVESIERPELDPPVTAESASDTLEVLDALYARIVSSQLDQLAVVSPPVPEQQTNGEQARLMRAG